MSPNLPEGQSILVRTDFTDDAAWRALVQVRQAAITTVDKLEFDS